MKKRIKKKRWLELKLAECLAREHLIMQAVTNQNDQIADLLKLKEEVKRNAEAIMLTASQVNHEMAAGEIQLEAMAVLKDELEALKSCQAEQEAIVERNAEAVNGLVDELRAENAALRAEVHQLKQAKKSWFGRK